MIKRLSFLAVAAVLALALSAPAHAGLTNVYGDSGGSSITLTGTASGGTASSAAFVDDITGINGGSANIPLFVSISITDVNGVLSGSGYKTIGAAGGPQVTLDFTIDPTNPNTFVRGHTISLDGPITSVTGSNNVDGYNFYTLLGGQNLTTISKENTTMSSILNHPGTSVDAGLGVTEQAAVSPEPSTAAIFGIGLAGFFAVCRYYKRSAVVA